MKIISTEKYITETGLDVTIIKEYEDWKADSVRRTALAKLTQAERLALGLN